MNTTEEEGMVGMNEKEKRYYDNFVRAVLSLQNEEEVKEFFEDKGDSGYLPSAGGGEAAVGGHGVQRNQQGNGKQFGDHRAGEQMLDVRTRRIQSGIGKAKRRG